jgi:hypothetical protein
VTREQREILRQAIDDAIYYRDPPQKCAACESSSALCARCAETLAIGLKYLHIAREQGLAMTDEDGFPVASGSLLTAGLMTATSSSSRPACMI